MATRLEQEKGVGVFISGKPTAKVCLCAAAAKAALCSGVAMAGYGATGAATEGAPSHVPTISS